MALFVNRQAPKDIFVPYGGVRAPARRIWVGRQFAYQDEVVAVISAPIAQLYVPNLFTTADWANPLLDKRLIANNQIWSYTPGSPALHTGTGRGGKLLIDNHSYILGSGGVPNSGVGGDAILVAQSGVRLNNPGFIYGGGGAGGVGGGGGPGYYQTPYTAQEGPFLIGPSSYGVFGENTSDGNPGNGGNAYWAGALLGHMTTTTVIGAYTYYLGARTGVTWGGSSDNGYYTRWQHSLTRTWTAYSNVYTTGGAGGSGGRGAGYNASLANLQSSGNAGAAGGTNAGTGGTGGTGGGWGQPGSPGATGNSGNNGAGGGGGAGGLAGHYITGYSNLEHFNNTGTVLGRVA